MNQSLTQFALLVDDYDEAIAYYTDKLGFELLEDTQLSETKRWVVIKPKGSAGAHILLAKAANDIQKTRVGNQTGGRVFLFLHTDNFTRDYENYTTKGVKFVRPIVEESYGTVSVFEDLYGNLWDLIGPR